MTAQDQASPAGPLSDRDGIFLRYTGQATEPDQVLVNGSSTAGRQQDPAVAASGSTVMVVWSGAGPDDDDGVYATTVTGTVADPAAFLVNTTTAGSQGEPAVAEHTRCLLREVEQDGRVLVDPEHERLVGQFPFQQRQPPLAQIAEAGVVGAALGVVVVRDHRHLEGDAGQEIEPVEPVGRRAHLVDLVHGHREPPQRERGGAGERDAPAGLELVGDIGEAGGGEAGLVHRVIG